MYYYLTKSCVCVCVSICAFSCSIQSKLLLRARWDVWQRPSAVHHSRVSSAHRTCSNPHRSSGRLWPLANQHHHQRPRRKPSGLGDSTGRDFLPTSRELPAETAGNSRPIFRQHWNLGRGTIHHTIWLHIQLSILLGENVFFLPIPF